MPNFGVNDNDRRTAEAMERIWAARRKEQVMSEVLTEEQIKAFRATGSVACGDGINTQYVAPDARKMILNTIDHWRQRAEQAEADRKVLREAVQTLAHSIWTEYGSAGTTWMDVVDAKCDDETSAALGRAK